MMEQQKHRQREIKVSAEMNLPEIEKAYKSNTEKTLSLKNQYTKYVQKMLKIVQK